MRINNKGIKQLRIQGLTFKEIGEKTGLSRQRVYQICFPRGQGGKPKEGREDIIRGLSMKEYGRRYVLFINGERTFVRKRPRPNDICELCGKESLKLEYHHWDDDNPELGIWVCYRCHRTVEGADKGLVQKYFELKQLIEEYLI